MKTSSSPLSGPEIQVSLVFAVVVYVVVVVSSPWTSPYRPLRSSLGNMAATVATRVLH